MGSFSDSLENSILSHVFGKTTFTSAATLYVGLFSVSPSDSGGGTEFAGNAYARVAVTNNVTNFPAAAGGAQSNGTAITFPTSTPAGWGTAVAVGFFDAASAGTLYAWGALTAARVVAAGDTPAFAIGTLTWTLD